MVTTRYKPFFSLSVSYNLTATGISTDGLSVTPFPASDEKINDFRLKSKSEKNISTVFFEGMEVPADAPLQCDPILTINSEEYFYFKVSLAAKEKIKGLKFHSSSAVAKAIGFPVLYDAKVIAADGTTSITAIEDVKFISSLFSLTIKKSETGSASEYAVLEIKDEKNNPVDLKIDPVKLTDKLVSEAETDRKFIFSIDVSSLAAGIYSFKAGNFQKRFFISSAMDVSNSILVIRVLKNNFLDYKKNLADNSFAKFELLIPAA